MKLKVNFNKLLPNRCVVAPVVRKAIYKQNYYMFLNVTLLHK